ncbi:MAG: hypothetical protein U1E77_17040 [Inhella sp.]
MHRRLSLLLLGLLPLAAAAQSPAPRDLRYLVIHSPGPAWVAGRSPFEQPGIQAHIAHYRQWQQQGKLALGGPFMDAAAGGMMLPEPGIPAEEVEAFAKADPAVQSGLLKVELRPWLIGMRKSTP